MSKRPNNERSLFKTHGSNHYPTLRNQVETTVTVAKLGFFLHKPSKGENQLFISANFISATGSNLSPKKNILPLDFQQRVISFACLPKKTGPLKTGASRLQEQPAARAGAQRDGAVLRGFSPPTTPAPRPSFSHKGKPQAKNTREKHTKTPNSIK